MARIKATAEEGEAVYHLISKSVNGERVFGATAKEVLRRMIWQLADFAGMEVITYTVLSNHFHILVRVPQPKVLPDQELLRRYRVLYPNPTRYQTARLAVIEAQLRADGPEAIAWRKWILGLMYDVSQFMKLLKERFTIWFNARHRRFGPMWSDRFKSVLIEATGRAVEAVALYIDLNCVRAGIVKDPKDYRWCGYAEAVAGRESGQLSIRSLVGGADWAEAQAAYRKTLFAVAAVAREGKASVALEQVRQVLEEGGKLTAVEVLRCQIRYFSQAAVLGGREFVETHLARFRTRTGHGERMAVRMLPAVAEWGELAGLRRFRGEAFG
jgi:hypothetical protein